MDYLNPEERDDWAEVQDYIYAITYAIGGLERLPLSNRLLRQTHEILMTGVRGEHKRPGQFRESQNCTGVSLKNPAFIPPHYGHVPDVMSDVEAFLHADDLFVSAALDCNRALSVRSNPHVLEANGGLRRLMISLYLDSEGLLVKPALYLSV